MRTAAELLNGVLTGKVSRRRCRDASPVLVAGRWSAPSELLDALERLGVAALLASADVAGDLGEVEDELFRFGQVVDANPALSTALADRNAPIAQRAELVRSLLAGKAKPGDGLAWRRWRWPASADARFAGALTRLVELAAERREQQVAYVTVAAPARRGGRAAAGRKALPSYTVGRSLSSRRWIPSVLGGMSVQVGSDLYDGTVAAPAHRDPQRARQALRTVGATPAPRRRHPRRSG